jgi:signal transduction histidine kinase
MEAAFKALLTESYVPDGVVGELSFSGDELASPKQVGLQAYLAMREAIRIAVRHSGCSRIGISLGGRDGELCGLVEDDGEGFDLEAVGKATPSWGVGLRSMTERAEMLGGSLREMQQMLESGKVKPAAFSRTHAEPSSSWTWTLQRSSSRCWPR